MNESLFVQQDNLTLLSLSTTYHYMVWGCPYSTVYTVRSLTHMFLIHPVYRRDVYTDIVHHVATDSTRLNMFIKVKYLGKKFLSCDLCHVKEL